MDQAHLQQLIQQALQDQEQRFTTTIAELRAEIAGLHKENSTLKTDVIAKLLEKPTSSPKPKLPHPDKFDGSLTAWEVWYPEMKAKLRIDKQVLGDEESHFWYIYGRLEKKVQALVAPQIASAERDQDYKTQTLFDQLSRLCDNPNAKRDAEDKLYSLSQFNDQGFNPFLAAFERLMYKAEANKWTDDAKIALLRRQLNDKMKRRLKTQISVPSNYAEFVKVLQHLDDGVGGNGSGNRVFVKEAAKTGGGDPMVIGALTRFEEEDSEYYTEEEDKGPKLLYNPDTGKYRKV
ncbi:hypothetical protein V8F06_014947 [Rhypophila decipiens]